MRAVCLSHSSSSRREHGPLRYLQICIPTKIQAFESCQGEGIPFDHFEKISSQIQLFEAGKFLQNVCRNILKNEDERGRDRDRDEGRIRGQTSLTVSLLSLSDRVVSLESTVNDSADVSLIWLLANNNVSSNCSPSKGFFVTLDNALALKFKTWKEMGTGRRGSQITG